MNHQIIRIVEETDYIDIIKYYGNLSNDSQKFFMPHLFSNEGICNFYNNPMNRGYVLVDPNNKILGYSVIRHGWIEHEKERICSYNFYTEDRQIAFYAPSVSDNLRGNGLSGYILQHILGELRDMGVERVFLWGGVKSQNTPAVRFYLKNGFYKIGEFEFDGLNYDMVKYI